jgi:hypothetical protein
MMQRHAHPVAPDDSATENSLARVKTRKERPVIEWGCH